MLELERACKRYDSPGGNIQAVDELSLAVDAGETVAIFGPSGSGKTTLLLLAAGLLQPDAGHVRFAGRDLGTLAKRDILAYRRNQLGLIFQNFNLVPGLTAEENVALPLLLRGMQHGEASDRALETLKDAGLLARAGHAPSRLSGGEQQRVAIARALVGEPMLVLADEPTGNLDSAAGDAILQLLSVLPRASGAALVLVTHDERATRYADEIFAMRDGRLTEHVPDSSAAVGR